ncbi:ATP-dependent nuclease [Roseibium sp.]|uniref:ATP-dependent nuclease n=1 Tax=Roseibium sp. TaxID=1936156 RepID=UPI003A97C0D6
MKLSKVRITGFQSFSDSGDIEFSDGINLIVGQNNAGKSSLLRALQPGLPDDRHRSHEHWEEAMLPKPSVSLTIGISGQEFRLMLLRQEKNIMPTPGDQKAKVYLDSLFAKSHIPVELRHTAGQGPNAYFDDQQYWNSIVTSSFRSKNGALLFEGSVQGAGQGNLPNIIQEFWRSQMFYFAAERMTIGESSHGYVERLSPKANNLPAVLLTLSGNRGDTFTKLIQHLREIFPTVGNISVGSNPNNSNIEIRVWPTEAMLRRELSFPLNNSGTGVAQVIAILTAIMTVENAVIVIDEINSFLHPAAVKALLRILQTEYSQHQYIISTHSPEVISFSNPNTLHLVKRTDYESTVERLDLEKLENFREVADHLGVSMADVFAADNIVWVEGPTEELCFPFVYKYTTGKPLPKGTIITPVTATGDLGRRKRDRQLVFEVYERLSKAGAPLVKSVKFSFDSEELTEEAKDEMQRDSGGRMHFLPRRHFECYLLNPAAIAAFLNEKDSGPSSTHTEVTVSEKLSELAGTQGFHNSEWNGDMTNEAWVSKVDAAKLIGATCKALTEQRVTFNKKADSLFLLKHVLAHNNSSLQSLMEYVCGLVDSE